MLPKKSIKVDAFTAFCNGIKQWLKVPNRGQIIGYLLSSSH